MPAYQNRGGNSGVVSYNVDPMNQVPEWISVTFRAGRGPRNYEYSVASCGQATVVRLVSLARTGRGLHSYITRNKPPYSRKW